MQTQFKSMQASFYGSLMQNDIDMYTSETFSLREYTSELVDTMDLEYHPRLSPVVDRASSMHQFNRRSRSEHDVVLAEPFTPESEKTRASSDRTQSSDMHDSTPPQYIPAKFHIRESRKPSSRKIKVVSKPVQINQDWEESNLGDRKHTLELRISELETEKQSLEQSVEHLSEKRKQIEDEVDSVIKRPCSTDLVPRELYLEQEERATTPALLETNTQMPYQLPVASKIPTRKENQWGEFETKALRAKTGTEYEREKMNVLKNECDTLTQMLDQDKQPHINAGKSGFDDVEERQLNLDLVHNKPYNLENKTYSTRFRLEGNKSDLSSDYHEEYQRITSASPEPSRCQSGKKLENLPVETQGLVEPHQASRLSPYERPDSTAISRDHEVEMDFLKECLRESQRTIIQLRAKVAQLELRPYASAMTKLVQTDQCGLDYNTSLHSPHRTMDASPSERGFLTSTTDDTLSLVLPNIRTYYPLNDGLDKPNDFNELSSRYPSTRGPNSKVQLYPKHRQQPNSRLQAERNALVHFVADVIAGVVDINNKEYAQLAKHLGLQAFKTDLPSSILLIRDRNCQLKPGGQTIPSYMYDVAWQNWTAVLAESLASMSACCGAAAKLIETQKRELMRQAKELSNTTSLIKKKVQTMHDLQDQERKSRVHRGRQLHKNAKSRESSLQQDSPWRGNQVKESSRSRPAFSSTPHLNTLGLSTVKGTDSMSELTPNVSSRPSEHSVTPGPLSTRRGRQRPSSVCSLQIRQPTRTLIIQSITTEDI